MKAVCFDLGNVIFLIDFTPFKKTLVHYFGGSMENAQDFIDHTGPLHDLGQINFIEEIKHYFGLKQTISEELKKYLLLEWNKTIIIEPKMIKLINELINEKVKIFFVSNVGYEHAEYADKILKQEIKGDYINYFSCQLGSRKPSMLYFKTLLEMYPETKNALYVDDLDINLEGGKKFGFRSHKFSLVGNKNIKKDLEMIKSLI